MTTTQDLIKRRPRLVGIVLSIVLGATGVVVPAATLAQTSAHSASKHHVRQHKRHRHHGRGIPQHNGGDADSDNNGGPNDGDGGI